MSPWSEHSAIGVTPFRCGEHASEGFHESEEYAVWADHVGEVARELGLPVSIEEATGSWRNGTEPSALIRIASRDTDLVDHFAATIARAGDQKAVVRFVPDRAGPDVAYRFELAGVSPERLDDAARVVLELPGASLEIGELALHVLGPTDLLRDAIAEMARILGREPSVQSGHFAVIEANAFEHAIEPATNGHTSNGRAFDAANGSAAGAA